ncbi:VanZ family protein [Olsenella profusa]|uniref:VanZ family protein n=1 Tax=Olsenella profusa TaxID=138595 RepID=A0ABS2F3M7_9ACTN|nr:VanZ family protein [Olsenella profusa]
MTSNGPRVGDGPSRIRWVAWALCLAGAVAAFAVTFALTEQTPEQTSALSSSVERAVAPVAPGSQGATAGGGGDVASILLSVANVRRWAHVPEFFAQGLFLFGAAVLWPAARRRLPGLRVRLAVALLACVACSLFDQAHKAFVPGREFDVRDLPFDAAGYLLALAVVVVTAGVVRVWRLRRSGRGVHYRKN